MTTRKKVAFVFATVLTALALIALILTAILAFDVWTAVPPETDDIGANLGYGLGKGIAVAFMIFTTIGTGLFGIPGGIVSFVNRKVEHKAFRGLFIGYAAADLVSILTAFVLLVATILFGVN